MAMSIYFSKIIMSAKIFFSVIFYKQNNNQSWQIMNWWTPIQLQKYFSQGLQDCYINAVKHEKSLKFKIFHALEIKVRALVIPQWKYFGNRLIFEQAACFWKETVVTGTQCSSVHALLPAIVCLASFCLAGRRPARLEIVTENINQIPDCTGKRQATRTYTGTG